MRFLTSLDSCVTSYPQTRALPVSGMMSVDRILASVVLPLPFLPSIVTISPRFTLRLTSFRTSLLSAGCLDHPTWRLRTNDFETCSIWIGGKLSGLRVLYDNFTRL